MMGINPMEELEPDFFCTDCGDAMFAYNDLVNYCPNCGAPHNSFGQRLRDDHNTESKLAQERGKDPDIPPM